MANLAVKGGAPLLKGKKWGGRWPVVGKPDEEALLRVLHSGKWCRGTYPEASQSEVGKFEQKFARYHDAKHGVCVTNGTAALELAYRAGGIGLGDEVICPSATFVATSTAANNIGGVPVFVDIDPETYDILPEAVERAVTKKTKAIAPVHLGGYPCDMDALCAIGKKHGLFLVEDCSHAHGSEWKGRKVGAIGDMGTFSFQMGKTLTSGEGGIVLTDSEKLAEKLYSLHNIGRIKDRPFYEFHVIAWNLRMTEFQGALLSAQFERFDEQIEHREELATHFAEELEKIPGVRATKRDPRVTRWGFYYYTFKFISKEFEGVTRDQFLKAVRAEGAPINAGGHIQPLYHNPVYKESRASYRAEPCPNCEYAWKEEALSIGHSIFLGPKQDIDDILAAIRKVRANTDELRELAG
ncbi:MAG: DegT/DnrJ/EryC1/StrS family aminotransferase [Planctomycetota bacterium]